jgi:hypothetical protein
VSLPAKEASGECSSFARIALHLDLARTGLLVVKSREQFVDSNNNRADFNTMSGYEMCHGKELRPPTSDTHCSVGSRMSKNSSCLTRLEQLTYDEASSACNASGGHLVKVANLDEANELRKFADGKHVGIGLRDYGANDQWLFDDNTSAATVVQGLEQALTSDEKGGRRRRRADLFRRDGCVYLVSRRRKGPALRPMDCETKADWVCQGTLANPPNAVAGKTSVKGDLMADEGAFCLWHFHEPIDILPNDEGKNFRNTDLQCHLQTSSHKKNRCGFNPSSRRRGLMKERGNRKNGLNYPVNGSVIGWTGSKASLHFLNLENSDDHFHCHYSPNNDGLLRVYAMQHMFDRTYSSGSMRKTCGCGYKYLGKLVSRCDCTRSGRADNRCAKWHREQLIEATNSTHPVRCNNCNSKHNL